jgi:hypothetical protein
MSSFCQVLLSSIFFYIFKECFVRNIYHEDFDNPAVTAEYLENFTAMAGIEMEAATNIPISFPSEAGEGGIFTSYFFRLYSKMK